jgi:UDP-glucose 4-epimerase
MTFPYRKALVTGGAGFIGSHIVERLLTLGLEVVSIDNYVTGKKRNLAAFQSPRLHEVACDVVDFEGLKRHFDGVDVVFHNAASKKTVCLKDPRVDLDTNAKGTFNILELCRTHGVQKLVHASTGSVYGEGRVFPQTEQHPLDPCSYYGVSKLAGEKYVSTFGTLYGLNVTILRYFHVYGPRQDGSDEGGVVAIFASRALDREPLMIHGDGTQMRSFTYVGDVVDANLLVATHAGAVRRAFNVASGIQISIQELADRVRQLTGAPQLPVHYDDWTTGDIKFFDVDNTALRSLGFEFRTAFPDGLAATVDWFRGEHGRGRH